MEERTVNNLLAEIYRIYLERENDLHEKYNRSLPFQDAVFDRWERAHRLGFGEGVSIYNSALVFGDVVVGRSSWIGPYVLLDGSGAKLDIGSYCSISAGVHIYTHDTVLWALTGGRAPSRKAGVTIGDCCFIGSQAVITPGISIGSQSVVGANSFVNSSIPERTIVAGSPANKIGIVRVEGDTVRLEYDETYHAPPA